MLNLSPLAQKRIRAYARLQRIEKDEIPSILFIASTQADPDDTKAFLRVVCREMDLCRNRQCAAMEYLDNCHDTQADDKPEIEQWRIAELPKLTPRFQRLVDVAEGGATTAEMASRMGIKRQSAEETLERALNALNKLEAEHA